MSLFRGVEWETVIWMALSIQASAAIGQWRAGFWDYRPVVMVVVVAVLPVVVEPVSEVAATDEQSQPLSAFWLICILEKAGETLLSLSSLGLVRVSSSVRCRSCGCLGGG